MKHKHYVCMFNGDLISENIMVYGGNVIFIIIINQGKYPVDNKNNNYNVLI